MGNTQKTRVTGKQQEANAAGLRSPLGSRSAWREHWPAGQLLRCSQTRAELLTQRHRPKGLTGQVFSGPALGWTHLSSTPQPVELCLASNDVIVEHPHHVTLSFHFILPSSTLNSLHRNLTLQFTEGLHILSHEPHNTLIPILQVRDLRR